jgi:hypothetical protein
MTEDRDPNLQAAYRALGAEEPPRALDEAILAAARRPRRGWVQRWSVPLSLAAVVVLSVVVTLRIQHEQPAPVQEKAPVAETPAAPAAPPAPAPAAPVQIRKEASSAKPVPPPAAAPQPFPSVMQDKAAEQAAGAGAPAAGVASVEGSLSRSEAEAARMLESRSAPAPAAARLMAAKPALPETPEQELEHIAKLRADGRHDEADKALAEFRKRLPDYRIPAAVLERVERR